MANMSYCRFQNTLNDLNDCEDYVSDYDLSDEENKARIELIELCKRISENFEDTNLEEEFKDNGDDN